MIWRPSLGSRLACLSLALLFLGGTAWFLLDGEPLSLKDKVEFAVGDVVAVLLLPVVLFRWRMVLEADDLVLVFFQVRRLAVRDIVDIKCVANEGMVFVCEDGSEHATAVLSVTTWGHRRNNPTRADLAARTVLCAAAEARGELPPVGFRLPPMSGVKRAALTGGVIAFVMSLLLGD